jgi:hypothetical protein
MESQGASHRSLADSWISDDLLAEAIAVWSRLRQAPVSEEEAISMLKDIKHIGEVFLRISHEKGAL